jgi:transposase
MNQQITTVGTSQPRPALWVGVDVAKRRFEAAVHVPDASRQPATRSFAMSQEAIAQFVGWCQQQMHIHAPGAPLRVLMEATGSYSQQLSAWLVAQWPECQPAIVNPAYIKRFGQSLGLRNKTDKSDARVIAHYGHVRRPAPQAPPSPEMSELRALVRERRCLVETLTAEKNRSGEPCGSGRLCAMRKRRMDLLARQIERLGELMRQTISLSPSLSRDIHLLDSIPGVGFITAVTVLGELGDLRRFADPRQLSAFAGLSPRNYQSGTSVNRPAHICRMGNKAVRAVLHLASRSLIGRSKHQLARFYEHLVASGKSKLAALAAMSRKMLVLMRAVLIRQSPYCPAPWGCEEVVEKPC